MGKWKLLVLLLSVTLNGFCVSLTSAQDNQVDYYINLLRTDLAAQRAAVIASNMHLSEKEMEAFWPVYNKYQKDLSKVGDEKVAVIKDYVAHYEQLNNEEAKELTMRALAVEEQRLAMIKKYIGEFSQVLSPKQVARFFQLELQMQRMIDLQVAAELPLVN